MLYIISTLIFQFEAQPKYQEEKHHQLKKGYFKKQTQWWFGQDKGKLF